MGKEKNPVATILFVCQLRGTQKTKALSHFESGEAVCKTWQCHHYSFSGAVGQSSRVPWR